MGLLRGFDDDETKATPSFLGRDSLPAIRAKTQHINAMTVGLKPLGICQPVELCGNRPFE